MSKLKNKLDILALDKNFTDNVTRWEKIPPSNGIYRDIPDEVLPVIRTTLSKRGIDRLYSHQAESFQSVLEGNNTVIVTPTASGKSLCYNLPVIQKLLENPEQRALYLFPTKALSQDQQSELNEIINQGNIPLKVSTYDGDTPSSVRVSARESGRIVISNPDMLHKGILPNHPKWIKFLSNLKYIIIDEVHIYRGIFGSHMTNVIRRLKRIARFYGSDPLFICCSATINNPLELTERIVESEFKLITNNGAPSGEKHIILYNPPLVDPVQGIRRGVVLESRNIAAHFLKERIKTIIFARSRIRTELIASYINKLMLNHFNDNKRIRVEAYRGGYLPGERRSVEKGLRAGKIDGVVSTNALELGIDIGGLDLAVLAGFPGSISSVWQQAGRAGRRNTLSAAVIIASASPTDQYLVKHPDYFFGRNPESAWINPDNIFILLDHLKCAVFELPFKESDEFSGPVADFMTYLEEEGVVRLSGGSWYWSDRSYPAEQVGLRSSSSENIVIINTTNGKNEVIGEMDLPSAKELLFNNAVYLHRGEQFFSKKLDLENKCCYVEESDLNYYTDSVVKTDIKLLHRDMEKDISGCGTIIGDVLVRSRVSGYKKLKFTSHENIGYGDIFLPEEEMHTRAAILVLNKESRSGKSFHEIEESLKEEILSRTATLIKNVIPVFLMCDIHDMGVAERLKDSYTDNPALYFYDSCPGGSGLAEGFLSKFVKILQAALSMVETCSCDNGCPSCIGPESGKASIKKELIEFIKGWTGKSNHPGSLE
ncbi:MAG: DEAD/DEAH box helicase [Spirochaetales bacterium]|nr:DEAD/DEAH box helicase [Spirochaetales bacterium]